MPPPSTIAWGSSSPRRRSRRSRRCDFSPGPRRTPRSRCSPCHSPTIHSASVATATNSSPSITSRSRSAPTTGIPVQLASDQRVRVRGFQETLRADESVLFQGFLTLRPGVYTVSVMVRDRNSPASARRERSDTVPRLAGPALAAPIPVYEGTGRASTSDRPQLLVNPRATLPYGSGHPALLRRGLRVAVRHAACGASGGSERERPMAGYDAARRLCGLVRARSSGSPAASCRSASRSCASGSVGGDRTEPVRTPFLVSFSSQWVITNYAEMVSLLRYFDRQDLVAKLRDAPPDQRAEAWREFWTATDPAPLTPENEALDEYLHRVQIANFRFQEQGRPGLAHRSRRGVHHAGGAGRGAGLLEHRRVARRSAEHPVELHDTPPGALLPGPDRVRPLRALAGLARRLPAGARPRAPAA